MFRTGYQMPLENFAYNPFYLFGSSSVSQTGSPSPLSSSTAQHQDTSSPNFASSTAANLMRFGVFDNPFSGIQTSESAQMRSNMMPVSSSHNLLSMGSDLGLGGVHGQQSGEEQRLCAVCRDSAVCQVKILNRLSTF
jgi:hypothetical protein